MRGFGVSNDFVVGLDAIESDSQQLQHVKKRKATVYVGKLHPGLHSRSRNVVHDKIVFFALRPHVSH